MKPLLLVLAPLATTAFAGSAEAQTPAPPPSAHAWEFRLVPYFWAASLDGTVEAGSLPPMEVDAGFADLLENLDLALMTFFSARRDRCGILADVSYTALAIDEQQAGTRLQNDASVWWLTLAGSYRVTQGAESSLEAFAGARYMALNNDASASGVVNGTRTKDEAWLDPLVGGLWTRPLGERSELSVLADVGGFGVGSDLSFELMPTLACRFESGLSLHAGYRWFDVDFEDSDFAYDVRQSGLLLGLGFGL